MNIFAIERVLPDSNTLVLYFILMEGGGPSRMRVVLDKANVLAPKEPRKRTRRMISGWSRLSHESRDYPSKIERPDPLPGEIDAALEYFRKKLLFSNE